MNEYKILVQSNPHRSDIPEFCQSGFLFNEPAHLQQQQAGQVHLLTALHKTTQQADARCAFFVQSGGAFSPIAAPFGSIEFVETLPNQVLSMFVQALIEAARSTGAATLKMINYPNCYAPKQAERLTETLLKHGFDRVETYQTFFLPVADDSFAHNLAPAERRRLQKCQKAHFEFAHWPTPNIGEVIAFLQQTRQQKGYPLTIGPERLTTLLHEFPNQCAVFVVTDGGIIAALTVAIRVRDDILYNFLPASNPDYQTFSPMVMLTEGLFTYCRQQSIRLLDLGVSLDANRQPKPSLMRFKRNLGAQESPKLIFEKTL